MADLDFIYGRRSIRTYTGQPVERKQVEQMLEAAMAAPSACCKDPWRFIVVNDRALREKIAEGLPNGKMLGHAAVGFIVCGDIEAAHGGEVSYLLQDCSAAIENLLLAVHALELGAVWLGVHPRQDRIAHIRNIFSLPRNIIPVSCIAVGHPAERKEYRTRFSSGYVHYDTW